MDTLQSNKYLFRPSRTDNLHFLPDLMGTIGQCEKPATQTYQHLVYHGDI